VRKSVATWLALLSLGIALRTAGAEERPTPAGFGVALELAAKALAAGDLGEARRQVDRALERDGQAPDAWALEARRAKAAGEDDERIHALHRELALRIAQGAPRKVTRALRAVLEQEDPLAKRYLDLSASYVDKLVALAKAYRKAKRPHSAIRVYQQVLALDPEHAEARAAIEEISAAPDPSLAETAKPKDLLADVSAEWIRGFDAQHATWEERARLERPNYTTYTDAGYEVMVRCAEAMEQMNAFYRVFFRYGHDDGKSVPRIDLNIFRERDTYLEKGLGPPVDWSKGHFTGGAVEVWIGNSGFDAMTGTLFHEAAHQFVSLATNAVGWLNEGLACFFEGCRIQANGTVLVNRPADGRLFSLADRMDHGWMRDAADGIDPKDPSKSNPPKAPGFRILIENDYAWGPPWYAPTWGLVYFLYNFQDPVDGRFVYRDAFREYVDTSGGRTGKKAVENFEKVVLAHPTPLTKSLRKDQESEIALPSTVDEVDDLWKRWILALRDQQRGSAQTERPYLAWAGYAIERKDLDAAAEHLEKGLHEQPRDVELMVAFADLLAGKLRNRDRATKLLHQALAVLESAPDVDEARIAALESQLERLDGSHRNLSSLHRRLERSASAIAEAYLASEHYLMAMYVSVGLGTSLRMPRMLGYFKDAVARSGKTLARWQLAYNEVDLAGWATGGSKVFEPYGAILRARFGTYAPDTYAYSFLTMDKVTSGDFSLEAEVRALQGESAFAGLVFGQKSGTDFHALFLFPEGYADLASFYGSGSFKTWRHEDVPPAGDAWHRLRVDVAGPEVDVWFEGRLVASQAFPGRSVLGGRFGLITGPGTAQFRSVRYLARQADDPGAELERADRRARAERESARRPGYHLGFVPPWPRAKAWVRTPRTRWDERGLVPTLVVLWSMKQNEVMPLHGWLAHVAATYASSGLEIVSVCEDADPKDVEAYLATHPFPGSVAVDAFDPKKGGAGETMDLFAAGRKGYPWVLLLDIDQRVIWEGNPGFHPQQPWKEGVATHVDTPLADLVERRNLPALGPWLRAWPEHGRPAMLRGDLAGAKEPLLVSRSLPADLVPAVAEAQAMLHGILRALEAFEPVCEELEERGMDAALPVLLEWADLLEHEVDEKVRRSLLQRFKGGGVRTWRTASRLVEQTRERIGKGAAPREATLVLLEKLARHEDPMLALLRGEIEEALAAGDDARIDPILEAAPGLPQRWLASEYLHLR